MSVGFVMLCHEALDRAGQVAAHWAAAGCPVVIHVDRRVPEADFRALVEQVSHLETVDFCTRHACDWGTWTLVAAAQSGAEALLARHPGLGHVCLVSGSCLPLRPVAELIDYLAARPETDFIESVTTRDVPWIKGGLDTERFTLRFPFSWRQRRRLFDAYVRLQRSLGYRRKIPQDIVPHMGSQWWCLTRRTLEAILNSPRRDIHDRYFSKVWIPDESYFQSMARLHSRRIESRSLTLSKFDHQGKPHVFYDDHLQLLRRSDCFLARKIWPRADQLYAAFLREAAPRRERAEPNPGKIDRVFARAVERRVRGRPGLLSAARFPDPGRDTVRSCAPYWVLEGYGDLFEGFTRWLHKATGAQVHGHLFSPARVEFAHRQPVFAGALSDSAALRDYNPESFLANLVWNTRGERQCFLHGPRDAQQIEGFLAADANARVSVISGAWAVPLFRSKRNFTALRRKAAELQKIESAHLARLRAGQMRASLRVWSMADFVEAPAEPLQALVEEIGARGGRRVRELPQMVDLTGFGQFLQSLKNEGMLPHLMGDFPAGEARPAAPAPRRAYVAR
ncbi:DUF5927 domain-containing protein [Profundibacterium mesophilum]|uniref:Peptide O-xylosyltransferase n=1 Tax=Profundibacterium mesophilum KAUST100406-0324 TaxID=1037889 RepID=A0A921NVH0_9RHOB|nr:beta-1,6-N-acetylglucosaminyltransferase [Profundibacterium mesophilum]KAF0676383.1 core-2I-branching enzyme family protein [Profundibacterium mesophilum KAUST100406-0324]